MIVAVVAPEALGHALTLRQSADPGRKKITSKPQVVQNRECPPFAKNYSAKEWGQPALIQSSTLHFLIGHAAFDSADS